MATPSFTDGLYRLDATQTRRRLAAIMGEARVRTDGDAVRRVESELLRTARWAVRQLNAAIVEARAPDARPETQVRLVVVEASSPKLTFSQFVALARLSDPPPPGC